MKNFQNQNSCDNFNLDEFIEDIKGLDYYKECIQLGKVTIKSVDIPKELEMFRKVLPPIRLEIDIIGNVFKKDASTTLC